MKGLVDHSWLSCIFFTHCIVLMRSHHEGRPPAEVQQSRLHLSLTIPHGGSSGSLFKKAAATVRVICQQMGIASFPQQQQQQQQIGKASALDIEQQNYSIRKNERDAMEDEHDAMVSQEQHCGCEAQNKVVHFTSITLGCLTVCLASSCRPRKNPPYATMQLLDSK
eukprot:1155773-Pelagomonas_calceolata.AAC.5